MMLDTLKGLALIATCIAVMSGAVSASAASREIEDLCFEQLQHATLPLRPRGAGEAFMANCIANLTPAQPNKRNAEGMKRRR
jgi:hypothetical protein